MSAGLAAATWPDRDAAATRLLHVDPVRGTLDDTLVRELPRLLRAGDLVVVNDAATLPASLPGRTSRGEIEIRLCGAPADASGTRWSAVLFGPGSWRERTEDRAAPPRLVPGERIEIEAPAPGRGLAAHVASVSPVSPRLVELRFDRAGGALWAALFRAGRPVQYSYVARELPLWHVQTAFAGRPVAAEMPSAGRPLRLPLIRALRGKGVGVASLTHAAGLSATGDPALDAALPLPEYSLLPGETVDAVEGTREAGGRVVAVGTTVVRALEGAARAGRLRAGASVRAERIGPGDGPAAVSGVISGIHAPGESHFELLRAFAPQPLLEEALACAAAAGYRSHEFGDAMLILAADAPPPAARAREGPGSARPRRAAPGAGLG